MIWREDCSYVYVGALYDPFVHAAYRLCGEFPGLPSSYSFRVDPQTVAREELARFIDSLSTPMLPGHNWSSNDQEEGRDTEGS